MLKCSRGACRWCCPQRCNSFFVLDANCGLYCRQSCVCSGLLHRRCREEASWCHHLKLGAAWHPRDIGLHSVQSFDRQANLRTKNSSVLPTFLPCPCAESAQLRYRHKRQGCFCSSICCRLLTAPCQCSAVKQLTIQLWKHIVYWFSHRTTSQDCCCSCCSYIKCCICLEL